MQNLNNGQGPMGRETVASLQEANALETAKGRGNARDTVQAARIHEGAETCHSRNQVEPKGSCLLPSEGGLNNLNNGQGPMGRETVAENAKSEPARETAKGTSERGEYTVQTARINEGAEPLTRASNGSLQSATSGAPSREHLLMRLDEKEVLYAAGFFDGEGCVMIGPAGNSSFALSIRVTNTNRAVLEWLSSRLGGAINVQTPPKKKFKKEPKPCWFWRIYSGSAALFLEQLLPHLIVKREHARLAIDFQERVSLGTNKLTDEELAVRRSYAIRMSELNNGALTPKTPILSVESLPTEKDYLYAAGILDGEGYILVHEARASYWLGVRVTNTNRELLEKLKRQFGGGIASKEDGRETSCWDWCTTGRGAVAFLGKAIPYLIVKHEQARLGIEFENRKVELLKGKALTEDKVKLGKEYKLKISQENRRLFATVPASP